MHLLALALASIVSLAAEDPAAPQGGRDFDAPPPGASPEDAALWRTAYDVNNRILLERGLATRLQATVNANGYEDRLDLLARRGHEGAEEAGELRRALHDALAENMDLVSRPWPVDPTRACRYPLLNFEGALYGREGSKGTTQQLGGAREEVRACVDKANLPLGALTRSNERLRGVLARLDRELPPLIPATAAPPSASSAGGTPGSGSAR